MKSSKILFCLISLLTFQNGIGFCQVVVPGGSGAITNSNNSNVGIGVSSPISKLHIDDGTSLTNPKNGLMVNHTGISNSYGILSTVNDGNVTNRIKAIAVNYKNPQSGQYPESYYMYGNGDNWTNGSTWVNGNIGVGTTSPTERFDINRGNMIVRGISNFAQNTDAFVYLGDNSNFIKAQFGTGVTIGTYNAPKAINVQSWTGNVGIGIVNPAAKLDVAGQVALNDNKFSFRSQADPYHTMQCTNNGRGITFIDNQGITFLLGLASNNTIFFNPDGKLGIGTNSPGEKLEIQGGNSLVGGTSFLANGDEAKLFLGDHNHFIKSIWGHGLSLSTTGQSDLLFLSETGYVGIGTGTNLGGTVWPSSYKLAVNGNIIANEIVVKAQPWPDYVFKPEYDLKPLSNVKEYIEKNQHLPGIPNECEIESSGFGVGEMVGKQMEKIEELTLYLIQLKQEIDGLRKENAEIKLKLNNK